MVRKLPLSIRLSSVELAETVRLLLFRGRRIMEKMVSLRQEMPGFMF